MQYAEIIHYANISNSKLHFRCYNTYAIAPPAMPNPPTLTAQ
jgi:hypothetical protein